jgi:hypothetical protein
LAKLIEVESFGGFAITRGCSALEEIPTKADLYIVDKDYAFGVCAVGQSDGDVITGFVIEVEGKVYQLNLDLLAKLIKENV